jgi:hypothetical protein
MLSSDDSTSSNRETHDTAVRSAERDERRASTQADSTAGASTAEATASSSGSNSSGSTSAGASHVTASAEEATAVPGKISGSQFASRSQDSSASTLARASSAPRAQNRLPLEQRKPLDAETREILRFELNSALLHFTQAERPVVLEGFGIIRPVRRKQTRTHHFGDWGIVREETLQTLEFEKCEDTAGLNLSMYARLVDTRELVQSIYSRLPLPLQLRWSERELRRLLIDFIREVRTEVVAIGFSDQLRGVGQMFALHNRQGLSPSDWFAGADIFMVPRQTRPLSLGTAQRFSRPVLENAWELWGAVLGPALKTGEIPLSATLKELGFPENVISDFSLSIDSIPFALFLDPASDVPGTDSSKKERGAIFVTDGLRSASLAGSPRQKLRHELVVRVPLAVLGRFGMGEAELTHERTISSAGSSTGGKSNPAASGSGSPSQIPSFVSCLLAAGALLLASDRMNPLRANAALALGRSITGASDSKLRSLLLTSCSTFGLQQLACDGPFNYATVLGLASDEAALLAARGRDHLFAILESRGLSQTTHPYRSSTLTRGYVELKRERQVRLASSDFSSSGTTVLSSNGMAGGAGSFRRPSIAQSRFSPAALSRSTSFAKEGVTNQAKSQQAGSNTAVSDAAGLANSQGDASASTQATSAQVRSDERAQDEAVPSSPTSSIAAAGIPRAD